MPYVQLDPIRTRYEQGTAYLETIRECRKISVVLSVVSRASRPTARQHDNTRNYYDEHHKHLQHGGAKLDFCKPSIG